MEKKLLLCWSKGKLSRDSESVLYLSLSDFQTQTLPQLWVFFGLPHTVGPVFLENPLFWFWPPCALKVEATGGKQRQPQRHLWYVFMLDLIHLNTKIHIPGP